MAMSLNIGMGFINLNRPPVVVSSGPVNLANNSWGNPSGGSVTTDGAGTVTFTGAGNGVYMNEVPTLLFEDNTLYDWSCVNTAPSSKLAFGFGQNSADVVLPTGSPSGQFTTGSITDPSRLLWLKRTGIGSVSGAVSSVVITKH